MRKISDTAQYLVCPPFAAKTAGQRRLMLQISFLITCKGSLPIQLTRHASCWQASGKHTDGSLTLFKRHSRPTWKDVWHWFSKIFFSFCAYDKKALELCTVWPAGDHPFCCAHTVFWVEMELEKFEYELYTFHHCQPHMLELPMSFLATILNPFPNNKI